MELVPKSKERYIEYMMEKYGDMVYRLALSRTRKKEDGEDVFQEVFLRLSRKLPQFENENHEKAWLIKVTINCSKTLLTSSWNKKTVPLEEDLQFENPESNDLYFEVLKLPTKYRTVIHLFYYEDLTIEQISKLLNKNPNTIKTQLTRAREKLQNNMKGGLEHEYE